MKLVARNPRVVVVEGLDGAGKTSISTAIFSRLRDFGVNCCHVDYSHSPLALCVRPQSGTSDASTKHLLHAAALLDSYRKDLIAPFDVVVADRYIDSIQAYYLALTPRQRTVPAVRLPTLPCIARFLLECPPEIRLRRIIARDGSISQRKRQTTGAYGTRVFSILQKRGPWIRISTHRNSIEYNVVKMMDCIATNAPELGIAPT